MQKKNWQLKLGIILIFGCIPFYLILALFPFLEMSTKLKIVLSTISIVIGEVMFWVGGFLVGKELFTRYKSYFNPKNWFRKNA
jgi:hypothetical protein